MIRDPETFEALLDSVCRFVRERLVPDMPMTLRGKVPKCELFEQ